jgi:hypothetical protein
MFFLVGEGLGGLKGIVDVVDNVETTAVGLIAVGVALLEVGILDCCHV